MVEEAGELLHAIIAVYRIAVWGKDPRYSLEKLQADIVDAIGDCAIYMVSYCNAADWDYESLLRVHPAEQRIEDKNNIERAVRLVAIAARFFESQTKKLAVEYMAEVQQLAVDCGYDFATCVATTWAKVQQRKR
jgi:NTP pyrophosphatase (non-canonical NTP hydrolase)